MKKKKIQLFDVIIYIIATFLLVVVAYPLILVLSNSVSDPNFVASGKILFLPKGFTLDGYIAFFTDKKILIGYANTIFYTTVGTAINLFVTVPAGYALSKKTVPGKSFFITLFMITMYFSGGMIPLFLVVSKLGFYNTRWPLLILGAFSVYNCLVCKSFFGTMPNDMAEAAEIDGCSPMGIFIKIILPLSKALIGVMVLYFAVGHWNSYFNALIYIRDDSLQPLQIFLRRILILAQQVISSEIEGEYGIELIKREALIRYSSIVVSSLPLMIIYHFLQKFFDKGVMIGSVKG